MHQSEVALVQKALIDFRNNPQILYNSEPLGISKMYGVCSNIKIFLKYVHGVRIETHVTKILRYFWQDWEYFSGKDAYPVPPNRTVHKSIAEIRSRESYYKFCDLYDENTEYGQLRWELVDHLIYKMELYLTEK